MRKADTTVRLAAVLPSASANGPGRRVVVWVQGCPRGCPDCCNAAFADPAGGTEVTVDELVRTILDSSDAEGLTFSGGEPFDQAAALALVVEFVRRERDLGLVAYSGYTLDELRASSDSGIAALLAETDMLIDGAFLRERAEPLLWRGSANQTVHLMTDRYRDTGGLDSRGPELEVTIGDGRAIATGDTAGGPMTDVARLLAEQYGVRL